jgi:hypothetical protein
MGMTEMRRSLSAREQEVLEFVVSLPGPGTDLLPAQGATAVVTEECECGCEAISFEVDREHTVPVKLRWPITTHNDPEDPERTVWLMLWGEDGWITAIEVSWLNWLFPESHEGLPSPEGFAPPRQQEPREPTPTARELWRQLWQRWRN